MTSIQKAFVLLVGAGMFTTAVTNPKGVTAVGNAIYKLTAGNLATSMGKTKIAA